MDDFEVFESVVRRSEVLIEIEEGSEVGEPVVEVSEIDIARNPRNHRD